MKIACSRTVIVFALAVSATPVFAQNLPVADCPDAMPPPAECASKPANTGIFYLPDGAVVCALAELDSGQDVSVAKTSRAGAEVQLCVLPRVIDPTGGEAQATGSILVGRRIEGEPALVEAMIRAGPGDDQLADIALPTASPIRLVFAGRAVGTPWIAFARTTADMPTAEQQSTTLRRVGGSVSAQLGLRLEAGLAGSALSFAATPGEVRFDNRTGMLAVSLKKAEDSSAIDVNDGISAIDVTATNAFGEEARLRIVLDRGYFAVDRSLAEKQTTLALLYKLEADELYLRMSGACDASRTEQICQASTKRDALYRSALETIPSCQDDQGTSENPGANPCTDEKLISTWNLIRADIAYRQKLIEFGLPFFGGLRTLKPTTPHQELLKMEDLLKSMDQLVEDIDGLRMRIEDKTISRTEMEGVQAAAVGQYRADTIDEEIAQLQEGYADLDMSDYQARNVALLQEIAEFQAQLKTIQQRIDAQSAQAAALTRSAIAATTGVPINEVEALASGDIKQVALKFVERQVLDPNSPLHTDLLASNKIALGLVEKVNEVKAQVERLESYQDQAKEVEAALKGDRTAFTALVNRYGNDDARNLLRQARELEAKTKEAIALTRSLDHKRALAFLARQLTPEQVKQIDQIVESIKPVEHVFEAAYVALSEGKFEDTLLNEFDTRLTAVLRAARPGEAETQRMRGELKVMGSVDSSALADPYFEYQVINAIDRFGSSSREIVSTIATFDVNLITTHPSIKQQFEQLSSDKRAAVLKALKEGKEAIASGLRYDDSSLCIERGERQACVSFADLRAKFRSKYAGAAELAADQINAFLVNQIDRLSSEQVLILYVARNGAGGFAGNLHALLTGEGLEGGKDNLGRAWDAIKGADGPLFTKKAVAQSGRVAVAASLTAGQFAEPDPVPPQRRPVTATGQPIPDAAGDPNAGGMDPTTNAVMQGALNYALPGAGVALQLGQTWASMDADRELQEDYMKRLAAAIREQEQLVRSMQTATRQSALANLQIQRARAVKEAGAVQIQQLGIALSQQMDAVQFNRELMALYRPQFYYIAETLRQKFDAFDRSLADWSDGVPESGFIKQAILDDPGNARLALDSEIQLFGWLNRNIESTRTGPYALYQHWRRLVRLARNYCNDNGCKPGDGKLGQIGITLNKRFFRDIQGRLAKRDFDRWRQDPNGNADFRMAFSFAPGQLSIPATALNARVIDFAIIPRDKDGNQIAGNAVQLTHTGISTLVLQNSDPILGVGIDAARPTHFREVRQVLLPHRFMPANRIVDEDPENLRRRFQNEINVQTLISLRAIEGYGVFGSYEMEVIKDAATRKIDDFEFRLTYIYKDPKNVTSEADFISRLEQLGCPAISGAGAQVKGQTPITGTGRIFTGALCNGDAMVNYRQAKPNGDREMTCGPVIASLDLSDERNTAFFRSLGQLSCLTIAPAGDPTKDKQELLADVEALAANSSNTACKRSELLLLTAFNSIRSPDADVNCFGDRK